MLDKKPPLIFTVGKRIVDWVYPNIRTAGDLPQGPVVYVANHCQLNGPLCCELHLPGENYLWGAAPMFTMQEAPGYMFQDFWAFKPKWTHPWFKLCAYALTPLSVLVFNYLPMVGVVLAFKNYKYSKGIFGSQWVGFKNFEYFFKSSDFAVITRNTLFLNTIFIITGILAA